MHGPINISNNKNLLVFKLAQHVSGNSLPIFRSARLWITACGIMPPDCCQSEAWSAVARNMCSNNILHTEHIVCVAVLQASDRQQSAGIIPHAVIHSLVLLKMGKELPEKCSANLKINTFLFLHLVGSLLYSCRWWTVKRISNSEAVTSFATSVITCHTKMPFSC